MLDVETLFSLICKEEDADSKHIYFFLFKLLRKSILSPPTPALNPNLATPTRSASSTHSSPNRGGPNDSLTHISAPTNPSSVEAHLGKPPFEEPSITKAIINFLFCKYGKVGDVELQQMFDACKLLLYCLNMWKFETPSSFSKRQTSELLVGGASSAKSGEYSIEFKPEINSLNGGAASSSASTAHMTQEQQKLIALYKLNYTRWICYNYVPSFCESLEKCETVMIFGVSFLRLVYPLIKHELQEKFLSEKDKIPSDKRSIFANYLPK